MPAWLSLAEFKSRQGISGTSQDATLTALLDAAEASVAGFIGGPVLNTSRTLYLNSPWVDQLALPVRPAWSTGLSVWVATTGQPPYTWDSSNLLTDGTDYRLRTDWVLLANDVATPVSKCGVLDRLNNVWGGRVWRYPGSLANTRRSGQGDIKVVVTVGWGEVAADLPGAITQAGYAEAAALLASNRTGSGGVMTSASLNGASYSLQTGLTGTFGQRVPLMASPLAQTLLWSYRDLGGAVGSGV